MFLAKHAKEIVLANVFLCGSLRKTLRSLRERKWFSQSTQKNNSRKVRKDIGSRKARKD